MILSANASASRSLSSDGSAMRPPPPNKDEPLRRGQRLRCRLEKGGWVAGAATEGRWSGGNRVGPVDHRPAEDAPGAFYHRRSGAAGPGAFVPALIPRRMAAFRGVS